MSLHKDDLNLDRLFRTALEPYAEVTPSEDLLPRVIAELETPASPLQQVLTHLLALNLPQLAPWAIKVQGQHEFAWQMELLPQINHLPQQILAMRLTTA